IQNELFDLGADLATPVSDEGRSRLRIEAGYVEWLEGACDEVNSELPALKSFVIPGGSLLASYLHVCRTICRRAERLAIRIEGISPEALQYLNRLSDLFFILAREANGPDEPLWEPGGSQQG
ncbi:MAG TPA: cob(I)yrinic acid a,c-diamide adenosyltransferase, partial [Solirubrobacterales bacterium]|nr:cob(I)yrinic acid a,c-diamide adenosyltransferase [Solirubrobacterales bacterium]